MERGSGELSLSNARNGKVKIRFFSQPSHSALNKPVSKNLGRATGEPLLHLFLSPTFSPLLTHPLDCKVFQAETTLCDACALDKGGLQSHMEASRSYTAANNFNNGFPTEPVEERFPYLIRENHIVLVSFPTLDSVTQDYQGL